MEPAVDKLEALVIITFLFVAVLELSKYLIEIWCVFYIDSITWYFRTVLCLYGPFFPSISGLSLFLAPNTKIESCDTLMAVTAVLRWKYEQKER